MGLPGRGLNGGREAKTASRKSPILSASLNIEGYGETKQSEGRYCQFCKKFNTGTSLSEHLHIHHQHEFNVGQKKFLPLASKIAHPDVPRGFAAMRSEAILFGSAA